MKKYLINFRKWPSMETPLIDSYLEIALDLTNFMRIFLRENWELIGI